MTGFSELLTASRFYLKLELHIGGGNEMVDATFLECQGFKRSQEAIEICEVTPNQWSQAKSGQSVRTKIPGNLKTENLVLRRGMTDSMTLWNWFTAVEGGKWRDHLAEGSLSIYDQGGTEKARFDFQGAWPMRYTATDVNAQSSEMEIEELEISLETFTRVK